jgi:hypothetical protein
MPINFESRKLSRYFLQIGLASVFLYASYAGITRPNDWVGYLPKYHPFISSYDLLKIFDFLEIIVAFWLLTGFKLFFASLTSTFMLIGITLANLNIFDVTFRDVGLLFSSLSLAFLSKNG